MELDKSWPTRNAFKLKHSGKWGWRHWSRGSGAKSTDCSSRGLGFKSQDLNDGAQPSVTPLPGDLMTSPPASVGTARTRYTDMHTGKTSMHIKIDKLKNSLGKANRRTQL